jgi:hypothetical protein
MAILATDKGGANLDPIPTGTHMARCVQMIHVGTVNEVYDGETKKQNKVRVTWELPGITHTFKEENGPEPRLISKDFTLSMNTKSSLRKFLDTWRGIAFTPDQAAEFDISVLIGIGCMLSVGEKLSKKNKMYNTIGSAIAIPAGVPLAEQHTPSSEVNYQNIAETYTAIPKWLIEKMSGSDEYQTCGFVFPLEDAEPEFDETPAEDATPAATIPTAAEIAKAQAAELLAKSAATEAAPKKKLPF